jgi:hypothetical protein
VENVTGEGGDQGFPSGLQDVILEEPGPRRVGGRTCLSKLVENHAQAAAPVEFREFLRQID